MAEIISAYNMPFVPLEHIVYERHLEKNETANGRITLVTTVGLSKPGCVSLQSHQNFKYMEYENRTYKARI